MESRGAIITYWHRCCHSSEANWGPLFEMMELGSACRFQTCANNMAVTSVVPVVVLQAIRCLLLVSLSTTRNISSNPWPSRRPVTTSIDSSILCGNGSVSYASLMSGSNGGASSEDSFVQASANKHNLASPISTCFFLSTVSDWRKSLSSRSLGKSPDHMVNTSGFAPCFPGRQDISNSK